MQTRHLADDIFHGRIRVSVKSCTYFFSVVSFVESFLQLLKVIRYVGYLLT